MSEGDEKQNKNQKISQKIVMGEEKVFPLLGTKPIVTSIIYSRLRRKQNYEAYISTSFAKIPFRITNTAVKRWSS